jgi:hypothetical protein
MPDGAPTELPPFMEKRVTRDPKRPAPIHLPDPERDQPAPELVSPVALSDELAGLLLTWADLHSMLGRALTGEMVTRAEAANVMGQLCFRAGDAYRRLQ